MSDPRSRRLGRRSLLGGGAAGLIGAVGVVAGQSLTEQPAPARPAAPRSAADFIDFYGPHQPGVTTSAPAFASFLGLDLLAPPAADRKDGLNRLLRLWSDDAARLMSGRGALSDQEPELAATPSNLTLTFAVAGRIVPGAADELPSMRTDALLERWGQTDLLIQLCSDDPLTLAHARRTVLRTAVPFARPRWRQDGFQHARHLRSPGEVPRNLLGQIDGTVNPEPGTPESDALLWIPNGPLAGGTHLVFRRIQMGLDTWERVGRPERERVLGRTIETGELIPALAPDAHVARARARRPHERFLRRGYNYDDADGSGLLFVSFQADIERQFLPVQSRLAQLDAMNEWTQAVGSATYTVLPGCSAANPLRV